MERSSRPYLSAPGNRFLMFKDVNTSYDAWELGSLYAKLPVELEENAIIEAVRDGAGAALNVYTNEAIHEIQFGCVKRPTHRSRRSDRDRYEVSNQRYTEVEDGVTSVLSACGRHYGEEELTQTALAYRKKGIDCSADGEYSEQSEGNYNCVNNDAMLLNHPNTSAGHGWRQSDEELRRDLTLMKGLSINFIRTSHYDEVRDCMLGRDITDYSKGDFDKFGFPSSPFATGTGQ